MRRSISKFFAIAAMCIVAIWLFRDSTVFALSKPDPVTGRGRGCYTELEILLGVKYPTEWIRFAELGGAGIFAVSAIAAIIAWRKPE